jgi:hypothetical protein
MCADDDEEVSWLKKLLCDMESACWPTRVLLRVGLLYADMSATCPSRSSLGGGEDVMLY